MSLKIKDFIKCDNCNILMNKIITNEFDFFQCPKCDKKTYIKKRKYYLKDLIIQNRYYDKIKSKSIYEEGNKIKSIYEEGNKNKVKSLY